jgi:hypothetical protein
MESGDKNVSTDAVPNAERLPDKMTVAPHRVSVWTAGANLGASVAARD